MRITIHNRGCLLPQSAHDYIHAKLQTAVGHYAGRIRQVDIRLINSRQNTQCLIKLQINHFKSIVIQATANESYTAIDTGADKTKQAINQHFNRARKLNRNLQHRYA